VTGSPSDPQRAVAPLLMAGAALTGALVARWPSWQALLVAGAGSTAWLIAGGRRIWPAALLLGIALSILGAQAWAGTVGRQDGTVEGMARLVGDPKPMPGGGWRSEVRIDGMRFDAEFGAAHAAVSHLLAGEGVWVTGRTDGSPRRWQRSRHVMGTITVMEVGATSPAGPVSGLANMLRRTLAAGAETLGPEASALLSGLVVGDDRSQSDRTADDFRAAGLGHLLAVSGQNVAFVLAAAGPLLHRLRFRYRLPLALLLLGFFALVTRFEPSVLRATVMAGGSALAAARGRSLGGLRLLATSVVALLVVDPLLVHRAAFQLSVAASAGILLASRSLAAAVPGPALVRETAGVTLAAQAAVAPILLASFGPMPVAAIPANLMAAPVAGPLMIWGITGGLLAGLLGPPFDWILHLPSAIGLWWIAEVARLAGRWSLGLLGTTAGIAVSLAVATVAVLSDRGSTVAARRLLAALLIALASISIMTAMSTPGAGIRDGIRLLDDSGAVVVVDRRYSAERLLESLRVRGVRTPSLIVFREPVAPGISGAVVERFGAVRIVGPPGSVDAEVPMDSTVVHVAGQAWLLDIGHGTLSMRRLGP